MLFLFYEFCKLHTGKQERHIIVSNYRDTDGLMRPVGLPLYLSGGGADTAA
jgi:hypothetical protein